jgi:hypothetical protein
MTAEDARTTPREYAHRAVGYGMAAALAVASVYLDSVQIAIIAGVLGLVTLIFLSGYAIQYDAGA